MKRKREEEREREREREREKKIYIPTVVYIYIYRERETQLPHTPGNHPTVHVSMCPDMANIRDAIPPSSSLLSPFPSILPPFVFSPSCSLSGPDARIGSCGGFTRGSLDPSGGRRGGAGMLGKRANDTAVHGGKRVCYCSLLFCLFHIIAHIITHMHVCLYFRVLLCLSDSL